MTTMLKIRALIPGEVFDYQMLMYALKDFKKPRDKVTALLKNEDIIQVKRGLYVFGEAYRRNLLSLEVISGMLVQPSYISREYALKKYGLLIENVETVTCMTIKHKKQFETPIGRFDYVFISKKKFSLGVVSKQYSSEGGVLFATKEKALADWIATFPPIENLKTLHHFLYEESRIDEKTLFPLDQKLIHDIASIYNNPNVTLLTSL
ncbi:MAG: hypothetical protein KBA81_04690 [Rhabdochlamydiaceae bacterium]|nr:hypothetical protein [Rhabdochlamydiaceae bacterium]